MKKITLYEYNRKNSTQISSTIGQQTFVLTTQSIQSLFKNSDESTDNDASFSNLHNFTYFDLSLVILYDNERINFWAPLLINVFQLFDHEHPDAVFIIDKQFAKDVKDALYHFIETIKTLEIEIEISDVDCHNIVDINAEELVKLQYFIAHKLFGNKYFQARLFEEIKKFRIFNIIKEQPIFSIFICGNSGIGKTETARLFHNFLCSNEKFIKINLGNYSDHNALSSLIGSPRGYTGSSKGELSDKIHNSKSTVILIDEFEKAGPEIHNFFLELLSDGKFTDSLGREYDLDKYIIVFTSNIKNEDVNKKIPAELRSRFDFMYRMINLTIEEKQAYVNYRCNYYLEKMKQQLDLELPPESITRIKNIDVTQTHNLRNLNKQIQINISNEMQET